MRATRHAYSCHQPPPHAHYKYFFLSFVLLIIYFLMRDFLTDMFAGLFRLFPAPWMWIRVLRVSARPPPLGTTLYAQKVSLTILALIGLY